MLTVLLLAFATAQAQGAAPPRDGAPSSAAAGAGTISGRVTDRETGRPLHRAIVTLAQNGTTERREALTDEQGRYEFTAVAAGEYGVSAGPGEMRATHLHQAFGRPAPMPQRWEVPRTGLRLGAGEARTGVDLALARALAIEGRILDTSDEPMTEVQLRLVRVDGTAVSANHATSDDLGAYRLFGLHPGRYHVCAEPEGDRAVLADGVRFVRTCHPSSISDRDAADVLLTDADASGVDVRVQRQGTFSVSGTVVDGAGVTVDDARVSATPTDRRQSGGGYARGENGRFTVKNLLPGHYVLNGAIGGPSNPSDTRPPARELEMGWVTVDVTGGDVHNVLIRLNLPQRVRGRIQFEGVPAPNAKTLKMTVSASSRMTAHRPSASASTMAPVSDDLTFEMKNIYPLALTVTVTGLPDGWAVKAMRYRGADIRGIPTLLTEGSGPGVLEIVATNTVARPRLRLTDPDAQESGYRVLLLPVDRARWGGGMRMLDLKSAPDGYLEMGAILPGEYLIAALTPQEAIMVELEDSRLEQFAAIATRVSFAPGDRPTLDLPLVRLPEARR